jgi:ABC-type transport system involved in multi-copper enzyme maturation permease subunit
MSAGRSPRTLRAIQGIALNTFREAIRDRILYLLLVFALVLIGVSRALSQLTVGSEEKIVKDLGLSAISIFGVLTAVFLGVSLVFKEVDKRTIFTLLANPVRRWHFIVGKYLGLLVVLTMNVVLMTAVLAAILVGESVVAMLPAVALILVELALITAWAILFSCFTNPILAAVGTIAVYVVGHMSWSFELLKNRIPSGWTSVVCDVLYWVLPNLSLLDIKAEVVHGVAVPASTMGLAVLYGLTYSCVVLIVACAVFERRDFN